MDSRCKSKSIILNWDNIIQNSDIIILNEDKGQLIENSFGLSGKKGSRNKGGANE